MFMPYPLGVQGVTAAWEHPPVLVTVDLNLPDMDGLDAARVYLVFVTARSEPDDEMAGMASGASAYLTKPFRAWQLTEAVNMLCPVGRPVQSE
jgi:DNA-binding response OmpR family regulator